jgi:hypothetical protein
VVKKKELLGEEPEIEIIGGFDTNTQIKKPLLVKKALLV